MHLHELLACFALISGVLVCVVLHPCRFVVLIKNLDLDWPFSGWEYGLARQASMPIGVACLTG